MRALFGTELQPLGDDEFQLGHTDEAEHGAQIGFQMLERGRRRAGSIEAAARDRHDDALVPRQTHGAAGAIAEGLTGHEDPVDPGLELARQGEVVHGCTDHHDVRLQKLLECGVACDDVLLRLRGFRHGASRRGQVLARQVRQGRSGQIEIGDCQARRSQAQTIDHGAGELSAG